MISVTHNLAAMNLQRQMGINSRKDKKNVERLSSGFRINRAADDAAGLVISEKMRQQIRGLNQGTDNAQDGVSWVQIGDGALDEVHDMLHRMTELSVQSLNETYTDADREAMEAEFNQLQSQIDTITQSTQFNTKNIFSEHEPTYYKVEGNLTWPFDQMHYVYSPDNSLEISYRVKKDDPPQTVTITIPEGSYTTQELADEIDDAIAGSPLSSNPALHFEYTQKGTFNANLEGGARIESVDGGLASLLNDTYTGGSAGALIGTTVFPSDNDRLRITTGKNDNMSFVIEDFSGNTSPQNMTLPAGSYTRDDLINLINNELRGTGVSATKYGTGIMLSGDDCIISNFKGNMFQIDGGAYTSVFYDNVYHGEIRLTPGSLTGGAVLPTSSYSNGRDEEHGFFEIRSGENDKLTFKANGADTETTITIPPGRYRIGEMVSKLNDLFSSNGLALTATQHTSGDFAGIKITSRLSGVTRDVGLSSSSSAYNTLFVDKKYNVYGAQATVSNPSTRDRTSTVTGWKQFASSSYDNLPLNVVSGSNDTFSLKIDGTSYNVTIPAKTYYTAGAIATEINSALSDPAMGTYSGKISATADGYGRLVLTSDVSARIVNLEAGAVSGNKGYADLFTTSYKIDTAGASVTTISLDRTFPNPTSISESDKNIRVESEDGKASYVIELPMGDRVYHQDIKNKIESTEGRSVFTDIKYDETNRVNGFDQNFSYNERGRDNPRTVNYSSTGVTTEGGIEGQAGTFYTRNDPASITIELKGNITIGPGTNQLQLTLNRDHTENLTFASGTYTPQEFANALQQKIDANFGSTFGGAKVTVSGNNIKITSRLTDSYGVEQPARDTKIECSTSTSTLLREINTDRTPATVTMPSGTYMATSGINVSSTDTFKFTLNEEEKTISLSTLSNASASSFASMLNTRLAQEHIPVTATAVRYSSNRYKLQLTTQNAGSTVSMAYDSRSGGTVTDAIFPGLTGAGSIRANKPIKQSITIEAGKDVFRYSVDGVSKSVTLTAKTYNRQELVDELNAKLDGAKVSCDSSGYITLTSDTKGNGSSAGMPYDDRSDSAMRAIWGQNESKAPRLTASFDPTDHLILESEDGTKFRIPSTGTTLVNPTVNATSGTPSRQTGQYSSQHATMDGGNLTISPSSPLVIDEWNDTLKFNYFNDSSLSQTVSVNVDHGTYSTYDDLRSNLQSKLDAALGSGEVTVSVDSHGVVISADTPGYARGFGSTINSSRVASPPNYGYGDFYDKVMNSTTERSERLSVTTVRGSNVAGTDKLPYVIGRRNVKDKPVTIKSDINDTLTLDFQYVDQSSRPQNAKFTMKLDEGTYQGNSLSSMIQEKLNEQLSAAGLSENLIEVGIGGTNAAVVGVDNSKVLTFKLTNSLPLPGSGEYVIDGIGGNAAFSVFYQTTGDLVPAYVEGVKDIDEGVVIEDGHNTLTFSTDNNTYSIEIPVGKYKGDELIDRLNGLLAEQNAPVKAEKTEEGHLKLSHKQMGRHPITNLSGTARGSMFFYESGGEDEDSSINLQFSSMLDDNKTIDRPPMSTSFLGINSITISRTKYAQKALDRIQGALDRVSSVRSYFGATQNAIEHVINRNNITSENTQAAESRIRDTEMAGALVEHSKQSILLQAGTAILSQANNNSQSVLQLLQ